MPHIEAGWCIRSHTLLSISSILLPIARSSVSVTMNIPMSRALVLWTYKHSNNQIIECQLHTDAARNGVNPLFCSAVYVTPQNSRNHRPILQPWFLFRPSLRFLIKLEIIHGFKREAMIGRLCKVTSNTRRRSRTWKTSRLSMHRHHGRPSSGLLD